MHAEITAKINISKLKLTDIADHIPQIVWITDAIGQLVYCNRRWSEYTGLSLKATINGAWIEIIHPEDIEGVISDWEAALLNKISHENKSRFKRAQDGSYRWHLVRGFPIKDDEQNILGWIGTSTDIDELQQTKLLLQKGENRYRTLLQSMHSIYWTVDPEGRAITLQPSWAEFSGQSFEEYKDFGWVNVIHPEDRDGVLAAWQSAVQEIKLYQYIARFWSEKDGDYIYCIARAAPFLDEYGQVLKWIGSCLDINVQKQTENKLKEVSEHLSLALKSAQAGTWSWDTLDNIVAWDENTYRLFGLIPDGSIKTYEDYDHLIHPNDREKVAREINQALEQKKAEFDCNYRITRPDGMIRLLTSKGKVYKNQAGNIIKMIGVCFDITERNQTETQIHQDQLAFAKESRARSISEIASSYAHELNQPLAALTTFIQGCINQLEHGNFTQENLLYALKESAVQAERAGSIIHRIKNSAQKKYVHLELTDLNALITESIKFIGYEGDYHHIKIHYHPLNTLPTLSIDKVQIQQVMINILRNSIESINAHQIEQPEIQIVCSHENGHVRIRILDNGPGFSKDILDGINHFVSTKIDGMGIGLSICRSIIEAHGGKLILSENPNKGACVQFTLPIAKE